MRNKINSEIYFVTGFLLLAPLLASAAAGDIRLNQKGFYPEGPKYAIALAVGDDTFYITSPDLADTLYSGALAAAKTWTHSGEEVRLIDFTDFTTPSEYTIVVPDLGQSHRFRIADYVQQDLTIGALRGFYYQRASMELLPEFAGIWCRPAGHSDTLVYVHVSAASAARPANTIISAPKGWYDAGDYGKYIVNSGISTYTVLALYEHFPEYYRNFGTGIPESGNGVPDVLDEALWNLRWMLAMQDPNDGGVYHKLTTANFAAMVMPHKAGGKRYVVMKSTAATLDFAAVMAQASRIFSDFGDELPGLADSCLTASLDAWRWARENPNVYYSQPSGIQTGAYGDGYVGDEFKWAAAELFITTGADSFYTAVDFLSGNFDVPSWPNVATLGLLSLAARIDSLSIGMANLVENVLLSLADPLITSLDNSAYHVVMGKSSSDFTWGSNGVATNQGMILIHAYLLTLDESYLEAALQNLDYLLGRNATGYCFVTGFGSVSPMKIHHRPSAGDGIRKPVPGLLAGGPNPGRQDGCSGYIGTEAARSYSDTECSYASNEIAINWNAPLVYLAGALEALYSPTGHPNSTAIREADEQGETLPRKFGLLPNYPNPFNPSTQIVYSLPRESEVRLGVYNLKGQLVRTLRNGVIPAGTHSVTWNADRSGGTKVGSGIYIVRLAARQHDQTVVDSRKILLLQ